MAQVVTKALVIREQPYQERDKLLTLFTEKEGKQKAIARGVRHSKSKMVAATQLFAYSEFVYYPGKNFASINGASLIEPFYALRGDMVKMALASYVVEVLDVLFDFYQGDARLLRLANYVLYYLANNMCVDDRVPVAAFALKAAASQGICPVLDHCTYCRGKEELIYFNVESGGTVCRECSHEHGMTFRLLPDQLTEMQRILTAKVKDLRNIPLSDDLAQRILEILDRYLSYATNRKLKAFQFYKSL